MQESADGLSAEKIDALLRKWLPQLPHPFTPEDRAAGYRHGVSILQGEFSLTQVLDRPQTGRLFFAEVIRENLDLGRPDHVQLIVDRRVTRRTPGRFRTRVLTEGVTPSLPIDSQSTRIKQYHKEGRALRTETTINNTRDFGIGKRLPNWRTALFCTRCYHRILRPGLAHVLPHAAADTPELRHRFEQLDAAIDHWIEQQKVPA